MSSVIRNEENISSSSSTSSQDLVVALVTTNTISSSSAEDSKSKQQSYKWSNEAIGMLIDAMKEEIRKGNFTDNDFKSQGWEAITKQIYASKRISSKK